MDRHGSCTGCDSTNADRDPDHDLRTHCDRDALDSNSDPQPDSVDHNRYHHQYRHLYPNRDAHRDQHAVADTVPTCDRDVHSHLHCVRHIHPDGYLHAFVDKYIYAHCFLDTAQQHDHPIHYIFSNHIPIT
jgi:hypothetical protein